MAANKALINYYARLIKKGVFTIDDIPEYIKDEVSKIVGEIPDPEFDPETQTPEIKEGFIPGSNQGIPQEELDAVIEEHDMEEIQLEVDSLK